MAVISRRHQVVGGPAHGSASSASPPSSSPSGLPSAENQRAKTVHAELSTTRTPPGGLLSNGPAGTHTSAGAGASASASASASESASASASASRSLPSLKPIRGGGAGAAEAAAEKDATGLGSSGLGRLCCLDTAAELVARASGAFPQHRRGIGRCRCTLSGRKYETHIPLAFILARGPNR